jgi:hypothetical protein
MTPTHITDGPLSQRLLRESRCLGQDGYPVSQQYGVELEELLRFVDDQGGLDRFWPRLTSPRIRQFHKTLQEMRVAYFLHCKGFPVTDWEPPAPGNCFGEFSVQVDRGPRVFVEVKSPGWEGEVRQDHRVAGRTLQEKYQGIQGGADASWRLLRGAIQRAYEDKFGPNQPSLFVIADDFFVPLTKSAATKALFDGTTFWDGETGYFTTSKFENLGGIALFHVPEYPGKPLRYEFLLCPNPLARYECALPRGFVEPLTLRCSRRIGE